MRHSPTCILCTAVSKGTNHTGHMKRMLGVGQFPSQHSKLLHLASLQIAEKMVLSIAYGFLGAIM